MYPITTTIDSSSPLIDYQPNTQVWRRGGWEGDKFASKYQDGTFMYCINATGATATFNFTGTEVHIYGAYRYNSGPYTVTIDGVKSDYFRANGSAPAANDDQQLFQVELYGIDDLEPGTHAVIVTNEWANAPMRKAGLDHVDIDYVTFSSSVESNLSSTVQTEDAGYFSFAPQDAWTNVLGDEFNEGGEQWARLILAQLLDIDHSTSLAMNTSATVSLKFKGDRVALYGAYGQSYSPYSARLDDGPTFTLNASRTDEPMYQQLLFKADSLDANTEHNLTLASLSDLKFSVDYAEVDKDSNPVTASSSFSSIPTSTSLSPGSASIVNYKTAQKSGSTSTVSTSTSATSDSDTPTAISTPSHALSSAQAGGIAAGSVLGAAALLLIGFLLWRQARKHKKSSTPPPSPAPERPDPQFIPYAPPASSTDHFMLAPPPSAGPTISSLSSRFLPGSSVSYPQSAYTQRSRGLPSEPEPPHYTRI
ncbi:hypothetical protein EV121DRAFT_264219 [Schizophyllum commune]